jgi:hypothetical protein
MLPILRILPVGGVLFAILILVLALKTPETRAMPPSLIVARGALIDRDDHPEWRQFLIQAALRRADELNRLRELADTPVQAIPNLPEMDVESGKAPDERTTTIAGLPATRGDADPDPDDVTGATDAAHTATIPVDIGVTSSFELPVMPAEESPPVIRTPERAKPAGESSKKPMRKIRRAKAKQTPPAPTAHLPSPFNLLESLISGSATKGGATKSAPKTLIAEPPQMRTGLN